MLDDSGSGSEEHQEQTLPTRPSATTIIWRYSLICGAAVVFAGYAFLVGTLAEDFSKQIIWVLNIPLVFLGVLALLIGVPAIALRECLVRRASNVVLRTGAEWVGDIIVALCILPLLLYPIAVVMGLLQLSTGQFLFGDEETRYRHLMMLSAYAGAFFGVSAGWKSKRSYDIDWATSIQQGVRVFLEAAFLAYAGLWLSKEPFEFAATQIKDANWEMVAITLLGVLLIFSGSVSLMYRAAQTRPEKSESAKQVQSRTRVRQQYQDLKRALSATTRGLEWLKEKFRK